MRDLAARAARSFVPDWAARARQAEDARRRRRAALWGVADDEPPRGSWTWIWDGTTAPAPRIERADLDAFAETFAVGVTDGLARAAAAARAADERLETTAERLVDQIRHAATAWPDVWAWPRAAVAEATAPPLAGAWPDEEREARLEATRRADRRAEELLLSSLSPEQRREWEGPRGLGGYRSFHVVTPRGTRYRIYDYLAVNVTYDPLVAERGPYCPWKGRYLFPLEGLCAYVPHVPLADHVLAQKLVLETPGGEEYFLSVAH